MENLKDKKLLVGGLAVIGGIALVAYLLKPKAPKRNSEGFFNAIGKGFPNRVPIQKSKLFYLREEWGQIFTDIYVSTYNNSNRTPVEFVDKLNLLRLKTEEIYQNIILSEVDVNTVDDYFGYILFRKTFNNPSLVPADFVAHYNLNGFIGLYPLIKKITKLNAMSPSDKVTIQRVLFGLNEGLGRVFGMYPQLLT